MRDEELDNLLAPLRTVTPSDLESRRWRLSVLREASNRFFLSRYFEWGAAMAAGLALGAFLFGSGAKYPNVTISSDATIEHIFAKAE